jgi:hypothetical protein
MALNEPQALQDLARRRVTGIKDLGAELRQRIAELGSMTLSTPDRRDAFAEVLATMRVEPYDLVLDSEESAIDATSELLHLRGLLVERLANGDVRPVALIERLIDFGQGKVEHVYLSVFESYRNQKIAPRLMLLAFDLYDRLGLAHITVHAGLESGRYYWAGQVGYDFADEIQRRHVERWATFVLGALGVEHDLDGVVEPQQWALLGTEVDPPITTSFSELRAHLPTNLPMALLDPNGVGVVGHVASVKVQSTPGMLDCAAHLRLVQEGNSLTDQQPIILGKVIMLSGPDWYGVFDLSDPARRGQYERAARRRLQKAGIAFP